MRKLCLKFWPYATCVVAGYVVLNLGTSFHGDLRDVLVSISATFLAIPLLYVIYGFAKRFSERRLNDEIFDYINMLMDNTLSKC